MNNHSISAMTVKDLNSLPKVGGSGDVNNRINVLLINPNTTELMTLNCLKMAKHYLAPDVTLYGYTNTIENSPMTVECHLDGVLSSADTFRDVYPYAKQADALLVACFSDHPLVNCLREEFDMPVCGIFEAGIYTARMLGGRFGIITTVARSSIRHAIAVRNMGLEGFCAGLLSSNLKVAELHTKSRKEVLEIMSGIALQLVEERGADVVILGCAGMADMQEAVTNAVKHRGVPVVDGVVCGVNLLTGLVRSGMKTSPRGLFASSLDTRLERGQNYV